MLKIEQGMKFGRWTILQFNGYKNHNRQWLCKCDCGTEKPVSQSLLTKGLSTSCGCYRKEYLSKLNTTHNSSGTRIYSIWNKMKERCYKENTKDYKNYGARGISICNEWLNSFETFKEWALNNGYQDNLTIERKDLNEDYNPNNCSWITIQEQQKNRRPPISKFINKRLNKPIKELAKEKNLSASLVYKRLAMGWSLEKSLNTPKGKYRESNFT